MMTMKLSSCLRNPRDYAQRPQHNCTFMNSISGPKPCTLNFYFLTMTRCWQCNFPHVCVTSGAGCVTAPTMSMNMMRGVRRRGGGGASVTCCRGAAGRRARSHGAWTAIRRASGSPPSRQGLYHRGMKRHDAMARLS
jgi:hypothetical protein